VSYLEDHRDLLTKLRDTPLAPPVGSASCPDGTYVEDLGYPLNLMPALATDLLAHNLEEAVEIAEKLFTLKS
jgi:hypothetical protein